MTTPETISLAEVIDALRTVRAPKRPTPSVAQLRRLIDDVVACVPLTQMVAELGEFDQADILSFTEEFGKHRARVRKKNAPKATAVTGADLGMLPGFGLGTRELARAKEAKKSGKRMKSAWKNLPQDILEAEGPQVVLPPGFEKTAGHGRDISKSVAALAVDDVADAEIIRFAERHFSESRTLMDADHVYLLHMFASRGLSAKLLEIGGLKAVATEDGWSFRTVGGGNTALAALFVEAFDLLEVARTDAMDALSTLVRGQAQDVGELRSAARKARWLAPGEITRLERLLGQVESTPDNTRLREILRSNLKGFALRVRTSPGSFLVTSVEQLNAAHLTQILSESGLLANEADEKAVVAELRTRLTEMGLTNDLDREIPEGLRAYNAGLLEEFYTSRQARVDGDPSWKELYEAAEAAAELATELAAV